MSEIMNQMAAYLLPMRRLHCIFIDTVSGREVHQYRERATGRLVMAESAMSWFRVPCALPSPHTEKEG